MSCKNQVLHSWPETLSTNQIATFFDRQYLYDMLVFLHEVSHQVKLVSETTTQGFPNSIREEWEILLGREFFVRWWESDKE